MHIHLLESVIVIDLRRLLEWLLLMSIGLLTVGVIVKNAARTEHLAELTDSARSDVRVAVRKARRTAAMAVIFAVLWLLLIAHFAQAH